MGGATPAAACLGRHAGRERAPGLRSTHIEPKAGGLAHVTPRPRNHNHAVTRRPTSGGQTAAERPAVRTTSEGGGLAALRPRLSAAHPLLQCPAHAPPPRQRSADALGPVPSTPAAAQPACESMQQAQQGCQPCRSKGLVGWTLEQARGSSMTLLTGPSPQGPVPACCDCTHLHELHIRLVLRECAARQAAGRRHLQAGARGGVQHPVDDLRDASWASIGESPPAQAPQHGAGGGRGQQRRKGQAGQGAQRTGTRSQR